MATSRREVIAGALGTAVVGARAASRRGAARRPLPAGACDCHTHVFPDPRRFPFARNRAYTPPVASVTALATHLDELGLDRVVVVAPSVYGSDLSATAHAMEKLGPRRARGVCVHAEAGEAGDLDRLHRAGFRGMRVNLHTAGISDVAEARRILLAAAARIGQRPWHVQVYAPLALLAGVLETLGSYPLPLVFDHLAGADGMLGEHQPGMAAIVDLLRSGRAHVKLSAPYRAFGSAVDWARLAPIARAFLDADPHRVVWGSDWPHPGGPSNVHLAPTDIRPPYDVDDRSLLEHILGWATPAERQLILVDNPAALYDFGPT